VPKSTIDTEDNVEGEFDKRGPWVGMEFLSMLRSNKDMFAEYSSYEELKRMR